MALKAALHKFLEDTLCNFTKLTTTGQDRINHTNNEQFWEILKWIKYNLCYMISIYSTVSAKENLE